MVKNEKLLFNLRWTALVFIFLVASGCENSIEPISDPGSYSVYGNLSAQSEPHFFRVRPIDQSLGEVSVDSLNATVMIINQSSGKTRSLQDSIVTFGETRTHNYWSTFEAESNTTYEIRVEGPGRPATTAQVTTPTATDAVVVPERRDCRTPLEIPTPPSTVVEVRFENAKFPFDEISVGFQWDGEKRWVVREGLETVLPGTEGIRFAVRPMLTEKIPPPTLRDPTPVCAKLDDTTLEIAYLYTRGSEEGTDSQLSFDPTQQERVKNGLGFFGAYRRDTVSVEVDTTFSLPQIEPNQFPRR
ncbi:DUF4249 family protein [Salinibacter ruber]|uniref:DUF4249 family protein n=1 Tax=Salinibacter ruber TaxID=146919 RepID=UPI0013C2F4A5|nr:DUF4249 family protein [Salinibacter ruber]